MRKLFLATTSLFWLAIITFAVAGSSVPQAPLAQTNNNVNIDATENFYTLTEVASHAVEADCWMAINDVVYDFTSYLPEHPSRPSIILPWCGKEASNAYKTKTKGRAHSSGADLLLSNYRIGVLK